MLRRASRAPASRAVVRGAARGPALAVLAGMLLLAAVLLALAGIALHDRDQLFDRLRERNELMARVLADRATRDVEGAAMAASTLAELLRRGLAPEGPELRTALTQTLVNLPFLRAIGILDAQGLVIGSTDPGEVDRAIALDALGPLPPPDHDLLGRFVPSRGLMGLVRGATQRPTPPGVGFLPLVRCVQLPTRQRVYLVALLNPEAFATFQQVTINDGHAAAALASYGGQLIAATASVTRPVGADLTALPPYAQFLPRLEQGQWLGEGLREGAQIAAFRVSATRPLVVLVEYARDAAMAEWWAKSRALVAVGAAAVLLIGAMTALAARSMRAREAARHQLDQAQVELARRGRELSVTFKSLQELIFRTDAQGQVTFVNERWVAITGQDAASAAGARLWELVLADQREAARALFAADGSLGARQMQVAIAGSDGAVRHFGVSVMPLRQRGTLVGFAGSAVDVTERVVAQQRLQAQLAFTELLMEVSPLPSSVVDLSRRYVLVNKAWEDFTGRPRTEVIGRTVGVHLPTEEKLLHEAQDRALLASGLPQRYEATARHHDGSLRDVVVNKLLLPGEDGRPAGILSVLIDVTEFRHAERATLEARDAAEEASRAKSEFIANISHELRTPLQSIIGFSELGLVRGRAHEKLAAMFSDIHGAGQRMLELVDALLDVSKIESAVGTMNLERTDLRCLVRDVAHEFDPLLLPRQLRLDLVLPEQALRAKVDPTRLQQVLRNVLANAVKFSPAGGRIVVEGEQVDSGELHLAVSDEGPGIPGAELDAIFEAFVQSSRTKDGSGGTGLGLAICRKIVDAHGGHIHAVNRQPVGATFHITLPARADALTQPAEL